MVTFYHLAINAEVEIHQPCNNITGIWSFSLYHSNLHSLYFAMPPKDQSYFSPSTLPGYFVQSDPRTDPNKFDYVRTVHLPQDSALI